MLRVLVTCLTLAFLTQAAAQPVQESGWCPPRLSERLQVQVLLGSQFGQPALRAFSRAGAC